MRGLFFVAALVAIIPGAVPAAPAADGVPKFDIASNCRAEVGEASGIGETIESCTRDEEQARQELAAKWASFSREDKTTCIREAGLDGSPSYVELQTCLEIASDSKALKDQ